LSNHRQDVETEIPAIYGSHAHTDQVVAVEAAHDHLQLSLTPAAAIELARVLVQYGSAVRTGQAPAPAPSQHYDPALWHDVGLALNVGVLRTTSDRPAMASRYVAPRNPAATGRRRNGRAPLTIVGGAQ
jgi:hypothetical protein